MSRCDSSHLPLRVHARTLSSCAGGSLAFAHLLVPVIGPYSSAYCVHFSDVKTYHVSSTKCGCLYSTYCTKSKLNLSDKNSKTEKRRAYLNDKRRRILNWILLLFLANVNSSSRSLYVIVRPSVVCRLSSVCNVRAPYSDDWNFRQCFYAIGYLGHLLTSR